MLNALTIDVEDYFQVHAFSHIIRYEDWDKYECRVEQNTRHILDILNGSRRTPNAEHRTQIHATFFCLGWIAERYPQLIKEIHIQGHEIASHGYAHQLIYRQSPEEFRNDIRKAKTILEDIIGEEVVGYRAPSYSITEKSKWAFGVLVEEGFKYDSSIFPIRHDFYGIPHAPRFPFMVSLNGNGTPQFNPLSFVSVERGTLNVEPSISKAELRTPNSEPRTSDVDPRTLNYILEFPISTVPLGGLNFPLSGGGYFRLFPYPLIKKGLKRINDKEKHPFIFYFHPWEIDPGQPRIEKAGTKSKFRHYLNLDKTEPRLKHLLKDFRFLTVRHLLNIN